MFEGSSINARHICLKVIAQVQLLSLIHAPFKHYSKIQQHILEIMRVQTNGVKLKHGVWCQWTRPRHGRYKLNINGSSRNGIITSGGVLRDVGMFIVLFSNYYGLGTITKAEFMALQDDLELCTILGVSELEIESDSQIVVQAVSNRHILSWKYTYVLRRCLDIYMARPDGDKTCVPTS